MLTSSVLAHGGWPLWPHDVLRGWNVDPVVIAGLVALGWAYRRGTARLSTDRRARTVCFWAGLVAVGVALLTPLDELASELASAHMVQHVVLILIAAPLLAVSAPAGTIVRGLPRRARGWTGSWVRRLRRLRSARAVAVVLSIWILHAGALWFWHASAPYEAALRNDVVHAVEHLSFLGTGLLFWSAVVPSRHGVDRFSSGHGALLVFAMALQSVLLSALLTFARSPWYDSYLTTTGERGLDPLEDQQLAGAIMWVPAGLVYVGVGIALVAGWVRDIERRSSARSTDGDWSQGDRPGPPSRLGHRC